MLAQRRCFAHEDCAPQHRRAEDHRQASCTGEVWYISHKHASTQWFSIKTLEAKHIIPTRQMRRCPRQSDEPHLQQHIFNFIHSVTEMMRYMTYKDLFLKSSMIPCLCTMKLNSVESLTICSFLDDAYSLPDMYASPLEHQEGTRKCVQERSDVRRVDQVDQ